jgi:hypothetical protein
MRSIALLRNLLVVIVVFSAMRATPAGGQDPIGCEQSGWASAVSCPTYGTCHNCNWCVTNGGACIQYSCNEACFNQGTC